MSLETELFKLIKKREYAAALRLLETNKTIDINALDEEGSSLFMAAVQNRIGASEERYTFIAQVLSHPDFQHANKPLDGATATPFCMAVGQNNPRLVELILQYKEAKDIQVIYKRNKLLCEEQAKTVEYSRNNPSSPCASSLAAQEQILAMLLEVTVHHAINTDDPSILQTLVNVGAIPQSSLNEEPCPKDLEPSQGAQCKLKVHQWLSKNVKMPAAYFFEVKQLTEEHNREREAIMKQANESRRAHLLEAIEALQQLEQPHEQTKSAM